MERVRYEVRDGVGWIDLDDGKMNVMSPAMQADVHLALDRAEADDVVTVLQGRPGVFSAGFDLGVLRGDDRAESARMVLGGFELARRVLTHPRPVVMACTGHAVAMGLFLLLSGDYRLGVAAPAKLTANEVAIGLTLPRAAEQILRHRLTPSAFQRAALLAVSFEPDEAVRDGLLDEVVAPEALTERAAEVAALLGGLDVEAQRSTKARVRADALGSLTTAIASDRAEYARRLAASVGSGV
jgi:enoyl-CoA hydratase